MLEIPVLTRPVKPAGILEGSWLGENLRTGSISDAVPGHTSLPKLSSRITG
jgi:hypothetical protein